MTAVAPRKGLRKCKGIVSVLLSIKGMGFPEDVYIHMCVQNEDEQDMSQTFRNE